MKVAWWWAGGMVVVLQSGGIRVGLDVSHEREALIWRKEACYGPKEKNRGKKASLLVKKLKEF